MDEKLWKYIGKGGYIDGIPARDLTAADWARMNEDERAAVENSGLYRRVSKPKVEEPVDAGKSAGDEKPAEVKTAIKQEKGKE